ncbi:hypothetical protein Efla_000927 [Eimeria flavescens]
MSPAWGGPSAAARGGDRPAAPFNSSPSNQKVATERKADNSSQAPGGPASSYEASSWLNRLFFCWLNPTASRCLHGAITADSLPPLSRADEAELRLGALEAALQEEEEKAADRRPSVLRATVRQFKSALLATAFFSVFRELLSFLSSFLLRDLLTEDTEGHVKDWKHGLAVAAGLSGVQLLLVFIDGHLDFFVCRIMIRVEAALLSSLYRRLLNEKAGRPSPLSIKSPSSSSSAGGGSGGGAAATVGGPAAANREESSGRVRGSSEQTADRKGAIFNAIFVDVPSAAEMVVTALDLFVMPLRIGLAVAFLFIQVGTACLPGVLTLLLVILLTICLTVFNSTLKIPSMKARDARLDRTHECLKEMRTLRLLGWEDIAEELVGRRRATELKWLLMRMHLSGVSYWLTSVAGMATSVATFAAYTIPFIQGRASAVNMGPELVIPVIHMLDSFVGPLTELPYSISTVIEGHISLKRIHRYFFKSPEKKPSDASPPSSRRTPDSHRQQEAEAEPLLGREDEAASAEVEGSRRAFVDSQPHADAELLQVARQMARAVADPAVRVCLLNASFAWAANDEENACSPGPPRPPVAITSSSRKMEHAEGALANLTFSLKAGELLLVTGPPGSGKTTLLRALLQLDSLRLTAGASYIPPGCPVEAKAAAAATATATAAAAAGERMHFAGGAPVGYVPQEPWLCGGSIRENIVFGCAFHLPTYNSVVAACELEKDFQSWRQGDLRVVDEGALDLSGGQRARVNIARAVYACKLHQMQLRAAGREADEALCMQQRATLDALAAAVAAAVGGRAACAAFQQEASGLLLSGRRVEKKKRPSSVFPCLLLLDECFNGLDLSVAGHLFQNLFGPGGLLKDCAVVVSLSRNSLIGLLRQHAGEEGFHRHRKEELDEEKGEGEAAQTPETRREMNTTIWTLAAGRIEWQGGPTEYLSGRRPAAANTTEEESSLGTIENLLAVREPCEHQHGEASGARTPEVSADELSGCEAPTEHRTMAAAEQSASGRVQASSYFWYLKHTGRLLSILFFLIVTFGSICDVASDLWLTKWTSMESAEEGGSNSPISSAPLNPTRRNQEKHTQTVRLTHKRFLWIFVGIAAANMTLELLEKLAGVVGSVKAARTVHARLWASVCNAPMWFYDLNPIGRILNRFSSDVSVLDSGILRRIGYAFVAALSFVLSVFVLSTACTWVVPLWPFMFAAIYLFVFRYFRSTSREVQRASLLSFSPLSSCFSEVLSGGEVITALRKQQFFIRDMTHHLNLCQRTKQTQWGISSWSSIRIELLLFPLVILNSTLPGLLSSNRSDLSSSTSIPPAESSSSMGLIGLAISYSISIAGSLRRLLSNVTIMEKEMCSVERIQAYLRDTEVQRRGKEEKPSLHDTAEQTPARRKPPSPPCSALPLSRTGLSLQKVEIRYRAVSPELSYAEEQQAGGREMLHAHAMAAEGQADRQLDLEANGFAVNHGFLKPSILDFSADIRPGERVGIVGRTGAGKSTLLQALYGILPCHKGTILLDGVRVDCLPRQVIRRAIGFLPQRSVIFDGWTVRDVLDPRGEHDDSTLWHALHAVGLGSVIASLPGGAPLSTVLMAGSRETHRSMKQSRKAAFDAWEAPPPSAPQGGPPPPHPLSAQQLRYLALARLVADAPKLRLVLLDEPPADEIWEGEAAAAAEEEGGASSSGSQKEGKAKPAGRTTADIIAAHFQQASVLVVAHHLSSLKGCHRVWVLSDGRKVGECTPEEIDSEQKFNRFVAACMKKPH